MAARNLLRRPGPYPGERDLPPSRDSWDRWSYLPLTSIPPVYYTPRGNYDVVVLNFSSEPRNVVSVLNRGHWLDNELPTVAWTPMESKYWSIFYPAPVSKDNFFEWTAAQDVLLHCTALAKIANLTAATLANLPSKLRAFEYPAGEARYVLDWQGRYHSRWDQVSVLENQRFRYFRASIILLSWILSTRRLLFLGSPQDELELARAATDSGLTTTLWDDFLLTPISAWWRPLSFVGVHFNQNSEDSYAARIVLSGMKCFDYSARDPNSVLDGRGRAPPKGRTTQHPTPAPTSLVDPWAPARGNDSGWGAVSQGAPAWGVVEEWGTAVPSWEDDPTPPPAPAPVEPSPAPRVPTRKEPYRAVPPPPDGQPIFDSNRVVVRYGKEWIEWNGRFGFPKPAWMKRMHKAKNLEPLIEKKMIEDGDLTREEAKREVADDKWRSKFRYNIDFINQLDDGEDDWFDSGMAASGRPPTPDNVTEDAPLPNRTPFSSTGLLGSTSSGAPLPARTVRPVTQPSNQQSPTSPPSSPSPSPRPSSSSRSRAGGDYSTDSSRKRRRSPSPQRRRMASPNRHRSTKSESTTRGRPRSPDRGSRGDDHQFRRSPPPPPSTSRSHQFNRYVPAAAPIAPAATTATSSVIPLNIASHEFLEALPEGFLYRRQGVVFFFFDRNPRTIYRLVRDLETRIIVSGDPSGMLRTVSRVVEPQQSSSPMQTSPPPAPTQQPAVTPQPPSPVQSLASRISGQAGQPNSSSPASTTSTSSNATLASRFLHPPPTLPLSARVSPAPSSPGTHDQASGSNAPAPSSPMTEPAAPPPLLLPPLPTAEAPPQPPPNSVLPPGPPPQPSWTLLPGVLQTAQNALWHRIPDRVWHDWYHMGTFDGWREEIRRKYAQHRDTNWNPPRTLNGFYRDLVIRPPSSHLRELIASRRQAWMDRLARIHPGWMDVPLPGPWDADEHDDQGFPYP